MKLADKSNIITTSKSIQSPVKSNAIIDKTQCNCQSNSMLLDDNNNANRKRIGENILTKNNKFRAKPFENKKIKCIFVVLRRY